MTISYVGYAAPTKDPREMCEKREVDLWNFARREGNTQGYAPKGKSFVPPRLNSLGTATVYVACRHGYRTLSANALSARRRRTLDHLTRRGTRIIRVRRPAVTEERTAGSWDPDNRAVNRLWAACLATTPCIHSNRAHDTPPYVLTFVRTELPKARSREENGDQRRQRRRNRVRERERER